MYIFFTLLISLSHVSFSQEIENNIFIGTWEITELYAPSKVMTRKDCKEYYLAEQRKVSDTAFTFFIPDIDLDGGPREYYYPKRIGSLRIKTDGSYSEYEYPRNFILTNSYSIFQDTLILENFESVDLSSHQCSGLIDQNFYKDYRGILNATQDTLTIFATDFQPKAKLVKKQLDMTILNNLDATILNPRYLIGEIHLKSYDGWGLDDIVASLGEDYVLVDSLGSGFPYDIPREIVISEENIDQFNGSINKIAFEIDSEKWVFEFTYYPTNGRASIFNYHIIYLKLLDWKDKYGNELKLMYSFPK